MNRRSLLLTTLSLAMAAGIAGAQQYGGGYQQGPPPPPPGGQGGYAGPGGYGGGGWDAPPPEFAEMRQRGFRDGIDGARKDFDNHRPPNVNNRDEFRDPHFIPRHDRREYKIGFRRGYDVGVQHIYGPRRGPRPY